MGVSTGARMVLNDAGDTARGDCVENGARLLRACIGVRVTESGSHTCVGLESDAAFPIYATSDETMVAWQVSRSTVMFGRQEGGREAGVARERGT
jgi:hypothetical protein